MTGCNRPEAVGAAIAMNLLFDTENTVPYKESTAYRNRHSSTIKDDTWFAELFRVDMQMRLCCISGVANLAEEVAGGYRVVDRNGCAALMHMS